MNIRLAGTTVRAYHTQDQITKTNFPWIYKIYSYKARICRAGWHSSGGGMFA